MICTIFVNEKDKGVQFLGRALYSLLDRTYYVFTREESNYPVCPVEQTMTKLKEVASHILEDRLVICFGCRVFPNNIQTIEELSAKNKGNLVFLKKLRGSKTWKVDQANLSFENERIADCGIFIIQKEDLLRTTQQNFNSFIRQLAEERRLSPIFINFWIYSNSGGKGNGRSHTQQQKHHIKR